MKKLTIPVYFGTLHGLNDGIAGFLLAAFSISGSSSQVIFAFLGYSLLAFGGQLPIGWLLDMNKKPRHFIVISLLLLTVACLLAPIYLPAAIILSGVASAMVHVGGGTVCYLHNTRSTVSTGIFTAPGVLGLIVGGLVGHMENISWLLFCLPILIGLLFILMKLQLPDYTALDKDEQQPILETHDYIMLVLLLAIAMRSMIWNILYMLAGQRETTWLLGVGIAAFAGKLFGGYIAEKISWKKYVFVSVGLSAVLLSAGKEKFAMFCAGVFLLQSAVPITLWLMQQYLHQRPAAATALSLGIAILLAGLPAYLEEFRAIQENKTLLVATFLMLFLLNGFWMLKTKSRQAKPS